MLARGLTAAGSRWNVMPVHFLMSDKQLRFIFQTTNWMKYSRFSLHKKRFEVRNKEFGKIKGKGCEGGQSDNDISVRGEKSIRRKMCYPERNKSGGNKVSST